MYYNFEVIKSDGYLHNQVLVLKFLKNPVKTSKNDDYSPLLKYLFQISYPGFESS